MSDAPRQTQRVWEADLSDDGRKLSLEELQSLEAMHMCAMLQEMRRFLLDIGKLLSTIDGRLNRIDLYLTMIDPRYPKSPPPDLAAQPELAAGR